MSNACLPLLIFVEKDPLLDLLAKRRVCTIVLNPETKFGQKSNVRFHDQGEKLASICVFGFTESQYSGNLKEACKDDRIKMTENDLVR